MILLSIVLFIALIGVLSYHKSSLILSTVILLAYTAAMGAANVWSYWMLLPVALVLLPFVITPIRQSLFSSKAMTMFQKVMPPMSSTEKEAIDAGTTWWEGDLFRGAPNWNKLHNYPKPQLTAEEQAFIDGPVETVCGMVNDFEVSHELADLPIAAGDEPGSGERLNGRVLKAVHKPDLKRFCSTCSFVSDGSWSVE